MKLGHYIKRVESSKEFKKFKKEHSKAYLCAGFFVIDLEAGKNMHQLDYYLSNGKVATAIVDKGVKIRISKQALKKKLPEINEKAKLDVDVLKGIVHDEMQNQSITSSIKKIIAIAHMSDGKMMWNLQCILDGLIMLQVHIDDDTGNILRFEKTSLLDLVRKI